MFLNVSIIAKIRKQKTMYFWNPRGMVWKIPLNVGIKVWSWSPFEVNAKKIPPPPLGRLINALFPVSWNRRPDFESYKTTQKYAYYKLEIIYKYIHINIYKLYIHIKYILYINYINDEPLCDGFGEKPPHGFHTEVKIKPIKTLEPKPLGWTDRIPN